MNSHSNSFFVASVVFSISLLTLFLSPTHAKANTTLGTSEITITGLEKTTNIVIFGDAWSTKDTLWAGTLKKWQKKVFEITSHQVILIKSASAVEILHPHGFSMKSEQSIISASDFTMINSEQCIRLNISTSPTKTVAYKDYLARLSSSELSNGVKETRNIETVRNVAENEYYLVGDFYDFHAGNYIYLLQGYKDREAGGNVAFSATALSSSECIDCPACQSIDRTAWMETIMKMIDSYQEAK